MIAHPSTSNRSHVCVLCPILLKLHRLLDQWSSAERFWSDLLLLWLAFVPFFGQCLKLSLALETMGENSEHTDCWNHCLKTAKEQNLLLEIEILLNSFVFNSNLIKKLNTGHARCNREEKVSRFTTSKLSNFKIRDCTNLNSQVNIFKKDSMTQSGKNRGHLVVKSTCVSNYLLFESQTLHFSEQSPHTRPNIEKNAYMKWFFQVKLFPKLLSNMIFNFLCYKIVGFSFFFRICGPVCTSQANSVEFEPLQMCSLAWKSNNFLSVARHEFDAF